MPELILITLALLFWCLVWYLEKQACKRNPEKDRLDKIVAMRLRIEEEEEKARAEKLKERLRAEEVQHTLAVSTLLEEAMTILEASGGKKFAKRTVSPELWQWWKKHLERDKQYILQAEIARRYREQGKHLVN